MTNNILKIKNLNKHFLHNEKKVEVLKNLNFSISKGELIALTGPSGSGKSTLLHMISLIEKPSSGSIFFKKKDTKDLTAEDVDKIRKFQISLIFQNNNLISDLSVVENVMLPLIIRNENPKKVLKCLKKFYLLLNSLIGMIFFHTIYPVENNKELQLLDR